MPISMRLNVDWRLKSVTRFERVLVLTAYRLSPYVAEKGRPGFFIGETKTEGPKIEVVWTPPAGFWAEPRPPKGFPPFSALKMARGLGLPYSHWGPILCPCVRPWSLTRSDSLGTNITLLVLLFIWLSDRLISGRSTVAVFMNEYCVLTSERHRFSYLSHSAAWKHQRVTGWHRCHFMRSRQLSVVQLHQPKPRQTTWFHGTQAPRVQYRFIYLLIDWLIDWLTDWLVGWLVGWLVDVCSALSLFAIRHAPTTVANVIQL